MKIKISDAPTNEFYMVLDFTASDYKVDRKHR